MKVYELIEYLKLQNPDAAVWLEDLIDEYQFCPISVRENQDGDVVIGG